MCCSVKHVHLIQSSSFHLETLKKCGKCGREGRGNHWRLVHYQTLYMKVGTIQFEYKKEHILIN